MKVSEYIVNFLVEKNITHVFGYPGGMVTELMDAFFAAKSRITAHLNYHEQAAAFAACGFAQASHLCGCAFATSGPGATNLITGICNAYFDSIPVIFITGQVNVNEQKGDLKVRQRGFQETDIVSLVKSVTKYAVCLKDADCIPEELDKAYKLAMSNRKGPVLIDIPMNLFKSELKDESTLVQEESENSFYDDFPVDFISKCFAQARSPVILIGAGVKASNCEKQIRGLISKLGIPAVSSMLAFDVLSDHPLYYGFIGAYGMRAANFIVAKCDLIIALGSRLDIRQVGIHREKFAPQAKIVRFDIDRAELEYKVHADEFQFCVDLIEVINNLDLLTSPGNYSSWLAVCDEIRELLSQHDNDEMRKVMRQLNRLIPDDSVITTDVGQNQVWVAQSFIFSSSQSVLFSGSFGAMGYSLPAAIGAYFGSGMKKIICITGDGGLQMNLQELQFLVREQLPVKIIVLNNHSLGMIRHFQEMYFQRRYFLTTKAGGYSTPDFAKLAAAYGIRSASLDQKTLESFNWSEGPELVEILLPDNTYVLPKLEFGKPNQDQTPLIDRDLYNKIMCLGNKGYITDNKS